MDDAINAASSDLIEFYEAIENYILSLGDDIQKKELKYYHAYSRIKNFVCTEIRTKKKEIILYLKVDFSTIEIPGIQVRDVSNIGHYGTGDTEVVLRTLEDLEKVKPLIEESYNMS